MYAVIETGGKQYRVQEGDVISVEKLGLLEGESYSFAVNLLDVGDVQTVLEEGRGPKVYIYKYKAKKGYHRKNGHRQAYTKLKIGAINA